MNQGKLEAVKQEMARVKINILGISELKWTGMGEFIFRVHHEKRWAGRSTSWNQDCRMKYKES